MEQLKNCNLPKCIYITPLFWPPKKTSPVFSCRKFGESLRGWGEEEARLMDLDSDQKVTFEAAPILDSVVAGFNGICWEFSEFRKFGVQMSEAILKDDEHIFRCKSPQ